MATSDNLSFHQSRPQEIVQQFKAAIEADFAALLKGELEDLAHINQYAARLHIHEVHLTLTVKQATGHSPCDLVNALYLTEAQQQLQASNFSVAQIALRLGFKEATNFTKYFKRHLGLSPKAYRAQCEATRLLANSPTSLAA
jgi:AraC family transcriptional regulator, regulatory protein of adaptative response / methylphosphotriester-DNA alkyltransferase methyltransferase